jgi:hypothetical protein
MSCPNCVNLCVRYRIGTASDLRKAIRTAVQNLQTGTLREVSLLGQDGTPTIQDLANGAPWNDIVTIGFEWRACGQTFRLKRKAKNDSGGYWEPA